MHVCKINWANTFYHSWYTFNFESAYKKPHFIKVAILSDLSLVLSYCGCRERGNKVDAILYGRYIIYKIVKTSHLKNYLTLLPTLFLELLCRYEQLNALSYLHIFWLNFHKDNYSFLHPLLLFGKQIFEKTLPRGKECFISAWGEDSDKNLVEGFHWGEGHV